jgi:hypothetical protein
METDKKMKIEVVTTFNEAGLKEYGQRMINTFCQNWPSEIILNIYPEKCNPAIKDHSRIILIDLDSVQELTNFKNKWKGVPKANGDVSRDPTRSKRKDSGKGFKWNAIRFAHKVYAIFDCARSSNADVLIWMDADTVCHSPITMKDLERMIPADNELCYLGRKGKYSECGLYAMNLRSLSVQTFLKEFQRVYDDAENGIFQLEEWHDSFVFDAVRHKFPQMRQLDWAASLQDLRPRPGMSNGEGHPLINSEWGAWLDHLKGDRKSQGKSKRDDLKIRRTESYWINQ